MFGTLAEDVPEGAATAQVVPEGRKFTATWQTSGMSGAPSPAERASTLASRATDSALTAHRESFGDTKDARSAVRKVNSALKKDGWTKESSEDTSRGSSRMGTSMAFTGGSKGVRNTYAKGQAVVVVDMRAPKYGEKTVTVLRQNSAGTWGANPPKGL
jgi:hypothetical protein